jgi:hypothetical protein
LLAAALIQASQADADAMKRAQELCVDKMPTPALRGDGKGQGVVLMTDRQPLAIMTITEAAFEWEHIGTSR